MNEYPLGARRLSRRGLLKMGVLALLASACAGRKESQQPTVTPRAQDPSEIAPELVADTHCVIGEGPLWHPLEQRLYWVDIPQGQLYRYDPAAGSHEQVWEGDPIGGFTIQQDGALLLFMARGAVQLWREGSPLVPVFESIPDEVTTRFNDVIADPEGRVFCGTMPTHARLGRLYRLDPDHTLTILLEDIGVSNGMGFSPDLAYLYYTDSPAREIYRFDYERATGSITNQRVFVQTPAGEGVPDGLTVDAEGYVWSARWDGGILARYSPEGEEVARIEFPARKVTSLTFGGPEYTDIYVTTAGGDRRASEGEGAGALFRLRLGIAGRPEFFSKINVG